MRSIVRNATRGAIKKLLLKYASPEVITLLRHFQSTSGKALAENMVHVTNKVPGGTVLVLAPHPDDEAIGMGGTLSMHLQNHSRVTVLYMTGGGGAGHNETLIVIRRKEAESIGKRYHIDQIFWDMKDTRMTNESKAISAMTKVLEDLRPSLVYLPSFFDHHFDHFSANQILFEALTAMRSLEVTVLGYEVWDNIPFPNYVVDISSNFEIKKDLLSYYATRLGTHEYMKLCENRNALHYILSINSFKSAINGYAEAFCRFDSSTYRALYVDYLRALRNTGSTLPSHVTKRIPKRAIR